MAKADVTAERLREFLDYSPETGEFIWRVTRGRRHPGDIAGNVNKVLGYVFIMLEQKNYAAHRLAWLHVHGRWPDGQIDHINGHRADNRLSNLREVSAGVNRQNLRAARKDNHSGFLGVKYEKRTGKWTAKIKTRSRELYLGSHDSPQQAHEAYVIAKRKLHEGCTI